MRASRYLNQSIRIIFIEKLEVKTQDEKKADEKKDGDKKDDAKADTKVADAGKDAKKDGDKKEEGVALQLAVDVKFRVSLMDNAVSGKGDVGVLFDYGDKDDKFYMRYNSLAIKDIIIKADFSAFKLDGTVKVMKKDPDYGSGFMGRLDLAVGKTNPAKIKMNAIYSNTDAVGRCFYFDGSYAKTDAPFYTSEGNNLQLNGIAVGFAWKMAPTAEKSEFSVFNKKFTPKAGRYSLIAGVPYSNWKPTAGDMFDGNTLLTVNFGGSYGIASVLAYGDIRVKAKTVEPPSEGSMKTSFASAGKGVTDAKPVESL